MAKIKNSTIVAYVKHMLDEWKEGVDNKDIQKIETTKTIIEYYVWFYNVDNVLTLNEFNELKEYRERILNER